jgi:hypothetical protein
MSEIRTRLFTGPVVGGWWDGPFLLDFDSISCHNIQHLLKRTVREPELATFLTDVQQQQQPYGQLSHFAITTSKPKQRSMSGRH